MKFSIPYTQFTAIPVEHENDIHEMFLPYTNQADAIYKYGEGKYRLVFILEEREDVNELMEVQECLNGNCAFVIPAITAKDMKEYSVLNAIYAFPCSSWHEIYSVASLGFKEVHIAPNMAMDMSQIKRVVNETKVKIRVRADKAQTDANFDTTKSPKSFWIRPEAVSLYEGLIDTMELAKVEAIPFYAKQESPKNLDNLIEGLPAFTGNDNYREIHDKTRMNCQMACRCGTNCNLCR